MVFYHNNRNPNQDRQQGLLAVDLSSLHAVLYGEQLHDTKRRAIDRETEKWAKLFFRKELENSINEFILYRAQDKDRKWLVMLGTRNSLECSVMKDEGLQPGRAVVAYTFNPRAQEAEAGGWLLVWGQHSL